jgi:NADPH-dependent 2,4-dienoyl-CoA reductase/sulfur reductase-like enzyme
LIALNKIVIVGASLAGVSAARALREASFEGEVTIVGEEPHLPYNRPPLSKAGLRGTVELDDIALNPATWYDDAQVKLRTGEQVLALDGTDRTILLRSGALLDFDGLVIATGAAARPMAGSDSARGPLLLRTIDDCRALRDTLRGARTVVVVGAGFIGLEVAATATTLGLQVTIVELAPVPLARAVGDRLGQWFADLHREHGVRAICGLGAYQVTGGPGDYVVVLDDGSQLRADLVVTAVGVTPRTAWLARSGVRVGDGVLCDAWCRTSLDGVVAAGDVSRWYNPLFDQQMRVEHWRNAVEQGRAAALSLIGELDEPYASVPYFWSDQYDTRVRFVGDSFAATEVHVHRRGDRSFVALFGRDGVIRAALCVNAPSALSVHTRQIEDRVAWDDAVDSLSARW